MIKIYMITLVALIFMFLYPEVPIRSMLQAAKENQNRLKGKPKKSQEISEIAQNHRNHRRCFKHQGKPELFKGNPKMYLFANLSKSFAICLRTESIANISLR